MFRTISILVAIIALGVVAASAADMNYRPGTPLTKPVPGAVEGVYYLEFAGPGDTFTFDIVKAQKAGDLTAATLDCCIVGDCWRVDLNPVDPMDKDTFAVGDGNITSYSGSATVHPWVSGTVTVSYDHGTDIFPAGMWVKFNYSAATGMNITPQF